MVVAFYSCAPSPETSAETSAGPGQTYALTASNPVDFVNEGGRYGMLRMRLSGDSARLFNPFTDYELTVAAYAEQRPENKTDSVYLEYDIAEDRSVTAEWHTPAEPYHLRFEPVRPIPLGYWPDTLVGQTFRVGRGGDSLLVHVAELNRSASGDGFYATQLLRVTGSADRTVDFRTTGYGVSTGGQVRATFDMPESRGLGEMRNSLAVAGLLADGTPTLYLLGTDTINAEPIDSLPLEVYPSLLPENMAEGDLLDLLNRGRLRVMDLPPEPDSVGIAYQNEVSPEHDPILIRSELGTLDISFAEDGGYTVFAGDRIVKAGRWTLSPDRNFLYITSASSFGEGLCLIQAYRDDYIAIPFPLDVETIKPRGVRLRSYYRPLVELRFYRD
ncbi:MAG: hypothetical protein WA952_00475 [Lewinella sp.]